MLPSSALPPVARPHPNDPVAVPTRTLPELLREVSPRRLRPPRPALARYTWVAVAWVAAFALTLALAPYIQRANFVFFWGAILFAAWYGGLGPAILAAMAAVAVVRWRLFPAGEPVGPADLLTLAIFAVASLVISALTTRVARARQRSEQAASELATLAEQLQNQSMELEQQTEEAQALAEELEITNTQLHQVAARAEDGLTEAERERARLRAVLDAMPDAASVYDRDWRLVYLNPAAEALARASGIDPATLLGRVVWEALPGAYDTAQFAEFRQAVTAGVVAEFEQYSPAPVARWFESRVAPTLDGAVVLSRDITARKRAALGEQLLVRAGALLTSSLDYRATAQQLAEMVVPELADWCAVDVMDLATGTLEPIAVAHADPARVLWAHELRRRDPPDPAAPNGAAAAVRTGRRQHFPEITDDMLRASARDAEQLRLLQQVGLRSAVVLPLTAQGRTFGALTLVWSDSERRHDPADLAIAEEVARRLALAIDNARLFAAEQVARRTAERLQALTAALSGAVTPAAVGEVVLEHGVRALEAQSGVVALATPDDGAIEIIASTGYAPSACMGPGRRWAADAPIPIAEAARTGEPVMVESIAAWAARYPGSYTPPRSGDAAWAAFPLGRGDTHGALLWTFDRAHAVTPDEQALMATVSRLCTQALERARLFEAEQRARQEAESANRAKSEFLATMSHELRTPINAALGYADLMALGIRGPVTEAQREDLSRLRRSQQRLLHLVNDVLNFARIESGHIQYRADDVPLDEVLTGAEALVAPLLRAKQLVYEYRPVGDGVLVRADRERLEQILLNLLSNAVKFTGAGGRVTLSAEARERVVEVRVADTGRGIPPDKLEAIFEPFVQVEQGLTRSVEGTGLGLAISREIARAMGSELTAASSGDGGSTFTLTLPRAGVDGTAPPADGTGPDRRSGIASGGAGSR